MKKSVTFFVLLCMLWAGGQAWGQTAYTWVGSVDTSWSNANNWSPARNTPSWTDTLVFDGAQANQPTLSAQDSVSRIIVNGDVTIGISIGSANRILYAVGGTPNAFQVASGAKLTINAVGSANAGLISVGLGGGTVSGSVNLYGRAELVCTDSLAKVTFVSGAVCNDSISTGNPFGPSTALPNSVRFQSGSTFVHKFGSNPFAATAPASIVLFDPGSTYTLAVNAGASPFFPSLSGRTYGNLTFGSVWAYGGSGASSCIVRGNLTIVTGANVALTTTAPFQVTGNVVNDGSLSFSSGRLSLNGTSAQSISGSGSTALGKGLILNNAANVTLQQPITVSDTLFFTNGNLSLGSNNLTLRGKVSGAAAGKCIVTDGTGAVVDTIAGNASFVFPVSPNATDFNPVTVALKSGDPTEAFTVRVAEGVSPSFTDNTKAVQRTWTIDEGTPGGNNAMLTFQWRASQEGAAFTRNAAGVWDNDGVSWKQSSGGATTGTDPYVLTTYAPATSFSPFIVANGVPASTLSQKSFGFGNVIVGQSATDTLVFHNTGAGALNITQVTSSDAAFSASPATGNIAQGDSLKIAIKFAPTSPGAKSGALGFVSNSLTSPDTVNVSGTGLESGIVISPTNLAFGNVFKDSTKTDTVTVTNSSQTNQLVIDSVLSANSAFSVSPTTATLDTMKSQKFAISFHPSAAGPYQSAVVFYHNGPTQHDTVKVGGTGILKAPILSANPTQLSFGTVLKGSSKTDTLTVTNTGYDSLFITDAVIDNLTQTQFTVSPKTARLGVGLSAQFLVTFAPTSGGPKNGYLVFANNSAVPSDSVRLIATGDTIATILSARAHMGVPVTLQGIITRALGFYTRFQDTTGGLIVYGGTGAFHDSVASGYLRAGDEIRVTGTISEFNSLAEINISPDLVSFTRVSRNNPVPTPFILTLAQIKANGEQYESRLIRIKNVSIAAGTDLVFGAAKTYQITDVSDSSHSVALRISNATDTQTDGETIPTAPADIVCVLGQFSSSNPATGYQLQPIDSTDVLQTRVNVDVPRGVPEQFSLDNNYPNPFNPSTTIQYQIPKQSRVTVKIYSILGTEVATLVDDIQAADYYKVVWNGKNSSGVQVASGVYFFRIMATPTEKGASPFVQVRKMMLMK